MMPVMPVMKAAMVVVMMTKVAVEEVRRMRMAVHALYAVSLAGCSKERVHGEFEAVSQFLVTATVKRRDG